MVFLLYFLVKIPIYRPFYKNIVMYPLVQAFRTQTKIFLKPFTSLNITKIVIRLAPKIFFPMKCILGFIYEYCSMRPTCSLRSHPSSLVASTLYPKKSMGGRHGKKFRYLAGSLGSWQNLILETKWRHRPILRECGENNCSPKVSKNYFTQVYGHKWAQKCH